MPARLPRVIGLALLASWMVCGPALAERVYYEVNGHRYWRNAKHRKAKRTVEVGAAAAADRDRPQANLARLLGVAPVGGGESAREPSTQQTSQVDHRRWRRPRLGGWRYRMRLASLRRAESRAAVAASRRTPAPAPEEAAPAPATPPAPPPVVTLPAPPPGPFPVDTVTYEFSSGTKTTKLKDGTVYVERFDPQAFFRAPVEIASVPGSPPR
jgi:hypothetical protein